MSSLKLHNTLTSKKEPFVPLIKGEVSLYVCGITPYDSVHLGHARCYVVFDLLKRVLRKDGYRVRHIQNFTDIDDRIIERANKKGISFSQYAKIYIDEYFEQMKNLNVESADAFPLVTENIKEIQILIQKLIDRGVAYVSQGDVFFSVRKYPTYGQLSKRKLDELEAGARVEMDEKKNDPLDFALWKKAKPNEPMWDSPWGKGRPGWHIECSVMSVKYLGEKLDLHGGGQDLIFPHHENEIAQSNAATGDSKGFAQFWLHNGFVTINKQKMSKSLGNFFTVKDILSKFEPMGVRYFLLTQHYRSPLNFSDQDLAVAQKTWRERILGAYGRTEEESAKVRQNGKKTEMERTSLDPFIKSFGEALDDDLNTPAALGALNQVCNAIFQYTEKTQAIDWSHANKILKDMLDVLGLKIPEKESWDDDILTLVKSREQARHEKNWKEADTLRQQLQAKGVLVEDTPQGPKLRKI